ncbi:MAG: DNA primase [Sporomusaceae bacterium]|jgi:DNA primase|nr:DNA primase [Sporomusaceae bacterium]
MKNALFDDFIERLRESVNIVNIVSDYVALTKKGRSFWGCCPFHQENTPSFSVSPDKGFFYCFGCQTGGDVFSFLMKKENVGFFDAVKILAAKMNLSLPEREKTPREKMLEAETKNLFQAGELARDFYHACLLKTNYGQEARSYLAARGVTAESIERFKIGFAPPVWDKLTVSLKQRGMSLDILLKAGLVVERKSQDGVYDRFRNRIMFPICDERGRVIGFGGRSLDKSEPKYLNSPETKLFNKRHVLYALDLARQEIKGSGQAIIVEGYLDAVTAHAQGFKNVVASLGTAFTPEQARLLLKGGTPEFIFAYDSDNAGQQASVRAFDTVLKIPGVKIKVVSLPGAKDPDEYLRQKGAAAFQKLLVSAQPFLDHQITGILAAADYSSIEGKIAAAAKVAPLLAACENAVERGAYLTRLSQTIGIDENALRLEVRKEERELQKDKNVKTGQAKLTPKRQFLPAATKAERQLIRLMFEHNEIIPYCAAQLSAEEIKGEARREIINFIFNVYNMKGAVSPSAWRDSSYNLEAQAEVELSEIMLADLFPGEENFLEAAGDFSRIVDDCIKAVKLAHLKTTYETHRLLASEMERAGNNNLLQELSEMQRIKNEIKNLHQN